MPQLVLRSAVSVTRSRVKRPLGSALSRGLGARHPRRRQLRRRDDVEHARRLIREGTDEDSAKRGKAAD